MRRLTVFLLSATLALGACGDSSDDSAPAELATETQKTDNPVLDWAAIAVPAITSPDAPRPPASSFVLAAMAQLAVYDVVMAVEGGYEPYLTTDQAPPGTDLTAAVSAAAYTVLKARVAPARLPILDESYRNYLAAVPDGAAKTDSAAFGERVARALLDKRASDGAGKTVEYTCSADPLPAGEFEPDGGCGTQPVDVALARVTPFSYDDPARFRPKAPVARNSTTWKTDLAEVRKVGAKTSTARTAEQTDVAMFWSEHTFVFWHRNLAALARDRNLDVADTAHLLASAYTAAADAAIAGFEAKYHYRAWRPKTSIPDAGWEPLLTVNHPEYPSGHGFVSAALLRAVAAHFDTQRLTWTLQATAPGLVKTTRSYPDVNAMLAEVTDARIWAGLHYRYSMRVGIELGQRVADHVLRQHFGRI